MPRPMQSETIRVPIPMPMKGVNRNFARGSQPDGTCWDALNVFPFDRQGRLRIALRGGAGKVEELEQQQKVRCLHIASLVNTPSSGGTSTTTEPFTYSNGSLSSVSSGVWTDDGDSLTVASNKLRNTGANLNKVNHRPTPTVPASSAFSCTLTINIDTLNVTGNNQRLIEFTMFSDDSPDPAQNGYTVAIKSDGASGQVDLSAFTGGGGTSDDLANAAGLTAGVDSVVVLNVASDGTATVSVDSNIVATVSGLSLPNSPVFPTLVMTSGSTAGGAALTIDTLVVTYDLPPATINRTALKLIATSGTDTYIGSSPTSMSPVSNTGSFSLNANSLFISAATLFGFTYIVDGTGKPKKLNLSSEQFEAFTESAGTAPTNAQIAVAWRGRLLLSGIDSDPQNIFASALGDPLNWDTGVDPPTETMAWAANASNLGRVGQPIHALIPLSDDTLLIGCEQSVWIIRGDPSADGSIDNISETAGILSQNAWCRAADGRVYFVGPNGLYRTEPDGTNPTEISRDTYRQYFQGIDRSTNHVSLIYDMTRYGVFVFVSPENEDDAPATSLFYDVRMEGFWPMEFTNLPVIGPLSAVYWDGFGDSTRYPVLGAYDGSLYILTFTNRRDNDGVANQLISGYVVLGPISLSSVDDAIMTKLDITGGEVRTGDDAADWHMAWTVKGGNDAFQVTEGTALITATGTFPLDGRAQSQYPRVRGGWFTVRIGDEDNPGDYFTLENVVAHLLPAGMQRV